MADEKLTPDRKALTINLNKRIFGTFAEIGAGQEVARQFFRVGGAAGTIAKTMSAYDMTFSDEIYGKVGRYVSRDRLMTMLDHEYRLLLERLSAKRGADTTFFVFADTVAARSFKGNNECHGWLGVRFQTEPLGPPNDIIIHVRMTDRENVLQQQALGLIGVNLLYGATYLRHDPTAFVISLLDELSPERIEVDMLEFQGPDLQGVDNRLLSLKLLQHNLTPAIMFAPDRRILQPSEVLYKRPIIVQRGRFRPVTYVHLDMLRGMREQFCAQPDVREKELVALFEITLHNLLVEGTLNDADFLARADTLSALGFPVMISVFSEHYRLTQYLRRYTQEPMGMGMGADALLRLFHEKYYQDLPGGMFEALGKLFSRRVSVFGYPMLGSVYRGVVERLRGDGMDVPSDGLPDLVTGDSVPVPAAVRHLYQHLLSTGHILPISSYDHEHFSIVSDDVLRQIQSGQPDWEKSVPPAAAQVIKNRRLFMKG